MRNKLPVILGLFFGLAGGACAEDAIVQTASKPVICVAPFSGNAAGIPCWRPALGQNISEMLIESLENSDNSFQVLESPAANSPQEEPQSGGSDSTGGSTGPKKSAKVGSGSSMKSAAPGSDDSGKSAASASAGSDFTFYGNVTQFGTETNGGEIGDFIASRFANLGAKALTAHVRIEWRIVDTESGKVITRGTTTGSASGSQFDTTALAANGKTAAGMFNGKSSAGKKIGTNNLAFVNNLFSKAFGNAPGETSGGDSVDNSKSSGAKQAASAKTAPAAPSAKATPKTGAENAGNETETIGYDNAAFMNSALGKATTRAMTNLIAQLDAVALPDSGRVEKLKAAADALKHTPGKVLAVAGKDTIIISLGSSQGFKEGDTLNLYTTVDVKDDKGNVVFTDEKLAGEITLQSVQDSKSRASYSGDLTVQQGWTVKAK